MEPIKATMRSVLLIMPARALAIPAVAQTRSPKLGDSQEPGSVIVFPKFINGPPVTPPSGSTAPASALKIGVVCPKNAGCTSDQEVTIRFHRVCGASAIDPVCNETDFEVTATVFKKLSSSPMARPKMATKLACRPKACPRRHVLGVSARLGDRSE